MSQARPAAFQAGTTGTTKEDPTWTFPLLPEASIDESQNSWGRLVAARVAGLEASHQAEVNELKRAAWILDSGLKSLAFCGSGAEWLGWLM